ncbi:MAG: hypothetical protein K0Q81_758 [Paenibacillus sp.]|nr:hypothetical protein [Paenibacillus sp.]
MGRGIKEVPEKLYEPNSKLLLGESSFLTSNYTSMWIKIQAAIFDSLSIFDCLTYDFLDSSDLPVRKTHLDAMRMGS